MSTKKVGDGKTTTTVSFMFIRCPKFYPSLEDYRIATSDPYLSFISFVGVTWMHYDLTSLALTCLISFCFHRNIFTDFLVPEERQITLKDAMTRG